MKRSVVLSIVAALALSAAATTWAQGVSTSQIAGVVRDSSGGVLPGVEVTVVKTDTGLTRTVFTDANGALHPAEPARSDPTSSRSVLQGFNTYARDGIVLQVQSNPTIDVTLAVGGVTEAVNVVANTADGRDQEHRRSDRSSTTRASSRCR